MSTAWKLMTLFKRRKRHDTRIRLLNNVINFQAVDMDTAQPCADQRFMGQHVAGQPTSPLSKVLRHRERQSDTKRICKMFRDNCATNLSAANISHRTAGFSSARPSSDCGVLLSAGRLIWVGDVGQG